MSKKSNKGSTNEQRYFTGDHKNIQFRKKGIYFVRRWDPKKDSRPDLGNCVRDQ